MLIVFQVDLPHLSCGKGYNVGGGADDVEVTKDCRAKQGVKRTEGQVEARPIRCNTKLTQTLGSCLFLSLRA